MTMMKNRVYRYMSVVPQDAPVASIFFSCFKKLEFISPCQNSTVSTSGRNYTVRRYSNLEQGIFTAPHLM